MKFPGVRGLYRAWKKSLGSHALATPKASQELTEMQHAIFSTPSVVFMFHAFLGEADTSLIQALGGTGTVTPSSGTPPPITGTDVLLPPILWEAFRQAYPGIRADL